jgi:hypothetical protein
LGLARLAGLAVLQLACSIAQLPQGRSAPDGLGQKVLEFMRILASQKADDVLIDQSRRVGSLKGLVLR